MSYSEPKEIRDLKLRISKHDSKIRGYEASLNFLVDRKVKLMHDLAALYEKYRMTPTPMYEERLSQMKIEVKRVRLR